MASGNPVITGHEFAKALEAAGVVSDLGAIERIVIDVTWDRVDVHVQRHGTERLLGLAPLIRPLMAELKRVTRIWVLMSEELVTDLAPMLEGAGLHLIERGAHESPGMRWHLFEDDGAPAELDDKRVDLTFTRTADGATRITGRQVIT